MNHSRAFLNRATAVMAIAILVLSILVSGNGSVAAQTAEPQQYDPATPQELEALERAAENVGAPEDPFFEGGYPRSMPEAAEVTSAEAIDGWSANWATGPLCVGSEKCLVGDFNGDDKDDVAVLYGDTRAEPARGDVMVATSKGIGFNASTKWADFLCLSSQVCRAGDVNADGKDDIVIFNPLAPGVGGAGNVLVALSNGSSFGPATLWQALFCVAGQVCEVGNVDGVGGDDVVLFRRSSDPSGSPLVGDVWIARSNGVNAFGAAEKWHDFFCIGDEECRVADMNGDARSDIVAFVKTGSQKGRVPVAVSTGGSFGAASDWAKGFCTDAEQCDLGDYDGNSRYDVLEFTRAGSGGTTYGDVNVRLSSGSSLSESQRWHDNFCFPDNDCGSGDFNGDGRTDIIRFVKQSADPALVGAAYVALAAGSASGFVPTPQATGGTWLTVPCKSGETCTTGDFNGDGLDDVVFFVRDSQSGASRGNVLVSLNQNGVSFGFPVLWLNFACVGTDICKVGDTDRDGRDDLIVFSRVQNGAVYVNRSTGSSFDPGVIWNPFFCVGAEVCEVGDFNGDGFVDIALFTRSTYGSNSRAGDVEVAINTGNQFVGTGLWHNFFCVSAESCQTGDVNGDGMDDIITFTKGSNGAVFVELSTGISFGDRQAPAEEWQAFFCAGNEYCDTADVNGDGREDILSFLQAGYSTNPSTVGDVFVGLSMGSFAAGGFQSQKWNDYFCIANEVCGTGFFNVDGRADIIAFNRGSVGSTFVALSTTGSGYFFADSVPVPPGAKRTFLPLVVR